MTGAAFPAQVIRPLRFQGDLSGVEGSPESPDVSGSDTVKMLNSERKLLFFQPGGERRSTDGKNAKGGADFRDMKCCYVDYVVQHSH